MRDKKAKEKEVKTQPAQPGLGLPMPALPILTQPPPFTIPPPNLSIPPPTILGQSSSLGGIPFPPPNSNPLSQQAQKMFDHQESQDRESVEGLNSPDAIDQQISMTERQINMVEQQLSMIQQAQGLGQTQPTMPPMHPQALFHQNQPNPMLFDLSATQLVHGAPQLIDQHQMMFGNPPPPLLGQPPPMLPISQSGTNYNINGSTMTHYGGRY